MNDYQVLWWLRIFGKAVIVNSDIRQKRVSSLFLGSRTMNGPLVLKTAFSNKQGLESEWKVKYLIVVEKTNTGFSAYSPDVAGCVATGRTKQEIHENMREALAFHLEGLQLGREEIPKPHAYSDYVELAAMA